LSRRSSRKHQAPGEPVVPAQVNYIHSFYPQAVAITQKAAVCILNRRLSLFQKGDRPAPDETASALIGLYLDMVNDVRDWTSRSSRWWHHHASMCRLALDMAKTDPRYFGVEDTRTERACLACTRVKPVDAFLPGKFVCSECGGANGTTER